MNSILKIITKNPLTSSATLLISSILIAAPSAVWAANISVSGDAQIRVAPDQIIISMGVLNKEKALDTAKKLNDKTTKSLISYLTDTLNIEAKHIQTDYLSVKPTYFSCNRKEEREGLCSSIKVEYYNLDRGIQIRLNDLTKYEALIEKSLALGVNNINNVQFVTTELRKHKDKARELAAIAAKEKAQSVAETLGMKVGKPTSININQTGWSYARKQSRSMGQNVMRSMGGDSSGGSSLAVGQINVTASVNVNFHIE